MQKLSRQVDSLLKLIILIVHFSIKVLKNNNKLNALFARVYLTNCFLGSLDNNNN